MRERRTQRDERIDSWQPGRKRPTAGAAGARGDHAADDTGREALGVDSIEKFGLSFVMKNHSRLHFDSKTCLI